MPDNDEPERLRRAQQQLEVLLRGRPDVTLIDIGLILRDGAPTDQVALRIHTPAGPAAAPRGRFPEQIDGIPVVVIAADYQAEQNPPQPPPER